MWQAPNQRVRAIAAQRKRDKERNRRTFHIKRVAAELKAVGGLNVPASVAHARMLLNDLSPSGVGLFSSTPMLVGQEISLTIEEPKRFYVRGRVVWCQEFDVGSHVLSNQKFSYRIGVEFLFQTPAEQHAVRVYCDELAANELYGFAQAA